ncbi:MAG: hypothetical protein JWQ15_555, partial [Marmoricola sp.]|nr:hypothetical protein [Marmoricola sp.]
MSDQPRFGRFSAVGSKREHHLENVV